MSYCITMVQTCKDYQEFLAYIGNIQCFLSSFSTHDFLLQKKNAFKFLDMIKNKEHLDIDYPTFKKAIIRFCSGAYHWIQEILYDPIKERNASSIGGSIAKSYSIKESNLNQIPIFQELEAIENTSNLDEMHNALDQIKEAFAAFKQTVTLLSSNNQFNNELSKANDELNKAIMLLNAFKAIGSKSKTTKTPITDAASSSSS